MIYNNHMWWDVSPHLSIGRYSEARLLLPALPLSAPADGQIAVKLGTAYKVAMMEPHSGFATRLAELIAEARDPAKAVSGPLSGEEIIDLLEEAILTLRMQFLRSGGPPRQ